ncbi:MAG: anthranilate synthase component I [Chloroflexota bacterium]|nr:anthranilate synthase component I [Chloroflexota bacterium]
MASGTFGKTYPSLDEARRLVERGNLIPVYREVLADTETPVSVYRKIARGPYSFLLESVEGGERLARYSFIGTEPRFTATLRDGVARTEHAGGETMEQRFEDPLELIKGLLRPYRPVPLPDMPRFQGGAVGYLAYECARYFERLPVPGRDDLHLPDAVLMLADTLVVFDHVRHRMRILSHADVAGHGGDVGEAYRTAVSRIDALEGRIRGLGSGGVEPETPGAMTPVPHGGVNGASPHFGVEDVQGRGPEAGVSSTFTKEEYEAVVERAVEYIRAGDVIQLVPSQRLSRRVTAQPFSVYRALRAINPSPYMYFLQLRDTYVVGASPEMLVQVEDGTVRTRPIAGTRPRGADDAEDAALAADLLGDEKERAEHIMLVDLGRNDLGRVCRPGSVAVSTLMGVEKYSHVMHIVSQVEGQLREDRDAYDALRSCFPAGTVSGAPKIRAMEIIAELEPSRRGTYAGAVGYFGFDGNLDTAITIRTMVIKDGMAHVQAGGGVVSDSQPEYEYQESLNKAAALLRALDVAEEVEAAEGVAVVGGAAQESRA